MSKNISKIVDVYESNFLEEIRKISVLIEKFNYISMDTEFPGFVYQIPSYTQENYYKTVKSNVDSLKLIQVGLTLCDEEGNFPEEVHTWQFNIDFDWTKDKYSYESISLLTNSGINFDKLKENGIPIDKFAEYLFTSGLILNENIFWITFHGSYDLAYLLKYVSGQNLPERENEFLSLLELYFHNFYDIRFLINNHDSLKGSLSKLACCLNIIRIGSTHQAGSDAYVTAEAFFQLLKYNYINYEDLNNCKNILFSLGDGNEDFSNNSFQNFSGFQNFSSNSYSNLAQPTKNITNAGNTLSSQKIFPNNKIALANAPGNSNNNSFSNAATASIPTYSNYSYHNAKYQNIIYNNFLQQMPNYKLVNNIQNVQNGIPYNNFNVTSMHNIQGPNIYLKNQMNLNGLVNNNKIPNIGIDEKSSNIKKNFNKILESQSN
jgi:CCR4-NOT transcription complex subunit 7/8